jgi:hypothetical protein
MLSKFLVDLRAGTIGGESNLSTGYLAKNGTAAAPTVAFASATTSGFFLGNATVPTWSYNGTEYGSFYSDLIMRNTSGVSWASGAPSSTSQDTFLNRTAAGVVKLAHGTATSTAEFQVSGGSGSVISAVKALTELTTIAAAATTNTAIQLPANAVILAVSVRVVTVIPTAATFTVTSATPAKTWNTAAGVAVAATTTDVGTAPGPTFQTTASAVTITPNLTPGAATGQVRVTVYYYQVTPATS